MMALHCSVKRSGGTVPADREWEHLRQYVELMNDRFGDQFELYLSDEARAADASVMKLIFQPIVENAVMHGYDQERGRLRISIHTRLDGGDRLFTVCDNGRGLSDAELIRVRARLQQARPEPEAQLNPEAQPDEGPVLHTGGIGLRNVHERLQLRYGLSYGLRVDGRPGEGLCITMRMPDTPYMPQGDDNQGNEGGLA